MARYGQDNQNGKMEPGGKMQDNGKLSELNEGAARRLFLAAEKLFAEKGFAATSVRDITSQAECNVAAVNYHFGSKENLYRQIFHYRLTEIRSNRIKSIEHAMDGTLGQVGLEVLIGSFSQSFIETVSQESGFYFIDMVVREMLDPQLPKEMFLTEFIEPVSKVFQKALNQLCPGLEEIAAQRCMYSIVGQLYHAVRVMNFTGKLESQINPVFDIPGLIDHIVRFSAGGIRAILEGKNEKGV